MRIAIDIRSFMGREETGIPRYVSQLISALIRQYPEHQYILVYSGRTIDHASARRWSHPSVSYHHIPWPNKLLHAVLLLRLASLDRLVQKRGDDIDLWFTPSIHISHLSRQIKKVLCIHDLSFEIDPSWFSWKRRLWHLLIRPEVQAKEATHIVTVSHNTKEDVARLYGIDQTQISVISAGHEDPIADIYAPNIKAPYFFFLGTIEPRKNIETLIDAYRISGLYNDGVQLYIAGAKGWASQRVYDKMEVADGVHYLGYISDEEVRTRMANAIAFIFPSLYEGFGLPVLEAMSRGVPVITSHRSSLPEITQGAAHLVDPHNSQDIADAMRQVFEHANLRLSLRERGLSVAERFRWDTVVEKLHSLFLTV